MIPLKDYRPSGTVPIITISLIIVNALVFFYQLFLKLEPAVLVRTLYGFTQVSQEQLLLFSYGAIPKEITQFVDLSPKIPFHPWITLITSMFLHGNLLHIGGNMLYLWIFGDNVEGAMGHVKFLLFYLLSGVIAAFSQIAANPNSTTPMIGASGAIAGVLGAYFLLYPYSRVLTLAIFFYFIRLIELPAVFVLGLWFLLQLLNVSLGVGGGVAWLAHAGGFIAGALLVFVFKKRYVQIGLFRKYY